MAAEKLTKHRLAQIIITLAVLVIAFFWRTITYRDVPTQECIPQPKCSLFVNGQKLTVTKSEEFPGVYIIRPIPVEWRLESDDELIREGESVQLRVIRNNSKTNSTININDSVNININD
ncbi:hypothetical protein J0676_00220 [Vibrio sp. Vb2880]|uniref:Uncharacterized protein n=1 Tax=Vibrio furnissii TaxID=29494 RepID=A0A0Q2QVX0_VIBFU|nr:MULTISPECIES: hypothetical protein [Vibrio]KQH84197.1 hypothetical protein AMR76_18375 [Vibrio furnissii]MBO0211911.1 hypothetical protein [Vibrio sp. Vb2880]MCG6212485.1 hypothetical protein [Vibrio furnissii]TRN26388.1 hypothetical protein DM784_03640 [Vibrio furnissii]